MRSASDWPASLRDGVKNGPGYFLSGKKDKRRVRVEVPRDLRALHVLQTRRLARRRHAGEGEQMAPKPSGYRAQQREQAGPGAGHLSRGILPGRR